MCLWCVSVSFCLFISTDNFWHYLVILTPPSTVYRSFSVHSKKCLSDKDDDDQRERERDLENREATRRRGKEKRREKKGTDQVFMMCRAFGNLTLGGCRALFILWGLRYFSDEAAPRRFELCRWDRTTSRNGGHIGAIFYTLNSCWIEMISFRVSSRIQRNKNEMIHLRNSLIRAKKKQQLFGIIKNWISFKKVGYIFRLLSLGRVGNRSTRRYFSVRVILNIIFLLIFMAIRKWKTLPACPSVFSFLQPVNNSVTWQVGVNRWVVILSLFFSFSVSPSFFRFRFGENAQEFDKNKIRKERDNQFESSLFLSIFNLKWEPSGVYLNLFPFLGDVILFSLFCLCVCVCVWWS